MNFFESVYELVMQIPVGKVSTYGDIARALGNPRMARQVGWALHGNPKPGIIPCHRVVNRFGRLSSAFRFGGENIQKQLLEKEGVYVSDDLIVDLQQFQHHFPAFDPVDVTDLILE